MFQTKVAEKIKTHFMFNFNFCFENNAVYELMWKSIVEPDRPHLAMKCGTERM